MKTAATSATDRRRLRAPSLLVAAAALLLGCDPASAPLNQYAGGIQLIDDQLVVSMGADCGGVTVVAVELKDSDGDKTDGWRVKSKYAAGSDLSSFVLGVVPADFVESHALDGDWRAAEILFVTVQSGPGQTASYVATDSFLDEAEERSGDELFVQDHGWVTPGGYEDLVNDHEIFPLCAPAD